MPVAAGPRLAPERQGGNLNVFQPLPDSSEGATGAGKRVLVASWTGSRGTHGRW